MHVATAMLPNASASQDRIFTTRNAVILLDGASAFVPVEVSPSTYVDTLGRILVEGLVAEPRIPLIGLLASAIEESAALLDLHPGVSPSSTVAIARQDDGGLDLLVLGDSQIATPRGIYVDDRIARLAGPQRRAYQSRLAAGHGYDKTHRELLKELQVEQARRRNTDEGYWIAEAVPSAAHHAITVQMEVDATPWLVLATDGAYRTMQKLGLDDWGCVAAKDRIELDSLLSDLDRWETFEDPDGLGLPRAKPHDDKSIAAVRIAQTKCEYAPRE